MATTQDCAELRIEETPRYEGATTGSPYRISTISRFFPIQTLRLDPAPSFLDRSDELRGYEGGPPQLIDGYAPAGSFGMRCYLNDLPFFLEIAGWTGDPDAGDGVITDPDGATIPTGVTRWVFTKRGGITAKTAQITACYADEAVFLKGQGFGITSLGLNADGILSADMLGLVVQNVSDPSLTPAYDAATIYPIRRGDLALSWLATTGNTIDFSLNLANPLVARRSLALATPSFFPDKMENADERVRVTGSMPKGSLADADIDALMAGTTFSATAKWKTSVVITTSYKYNLWIEMPKCQYTGGQVDELANRRRFGGTFDWWAAWDEGAGYDAKITITNAVAAIATYS